MLAWSYFISSLTSFVIGVVGWFTYKVYIWPYYISPLRKIPGPPSENPISGNLKRIFVEEVNIIYYLFDGPLDFILTLDISFFFLLSVNYFFILLKVYDNYI